MQTNIQHAVGLTGKRLRLLKQIIQMVTSLFSNLGVKRKPGWEGRIHLLCPKGFSMKISNRLSSGGYFGKKYAKE